MGLGAFGRFVFKKIERFRHILREKKDGRPAPGSQQDEHQDPQDQPFFQRRFLRNREDFIERFRGNFRVFFSHRCPSVLVIGSQTDALLGGGDYPRWRLRLPIKQSLCQVEIEPI